MELYKKYRPKLWKEVIGQDEAIKRIKNDLRNNKQRHYLIAGKYGAGKTTIAMLIAKTLNCENIGEDLEPCNSCPACINIDEGAETGISYISSAEAGGVEDIREIINTVNLAGNVRTRVIILDEAQNLSPKAFEALLIPLEEKSEGRFCFILCSTAPEKMPAPLKSRVGLVNVFPIKEREMFDYLVKIIKEEGLDVSQENLVKVVKSSSGSLREALSRIDSGRYDESDFSLETFKLFCEGKAYELIEKVNDLLESENVSPRTVALEITGNLVNLIFAKNKLKPVGLRFTESELELFYNNLRGKKGILYASNSFSDFVKSTQFLTDSEMSKMFGAVALEVMSKIFEEKPKKS